MTSTPRTAPVVELGVKDLTPDGELFCPNPKAGMKIWDTHPRVFLRLDDSGHAKCSYCGTEYQLKAGEKLPTVVAEMRSHDPT